MIDLTTLELFILATGALGLGIVMLLKGGTWTIDAAVYVARKVHMSPMLIGFTIVAFGTSLPELIVSVNANLTGLPGIAIGNVIGSNIANILLVLGATATVTTLVVIPRDILRDSVMMILATILMTVLILDDQISRLAGFGMVGVLLAYVVWQYRLAKSGKIKIEVDVEDSDYKNMWVAIGFLLFGLAFIALGAEFLVRGAKVCAEIIGVPDAVIGLSIIALGTSLPELSTCVIAAMRRQTDLIIGNILGSNVFNILMILGVASMVKPITGGQLAEQVAKVDIWVVLAVSTVFALLLFFYRKIDRAVGIVFILLYILYIAAIYALYLQGTTLI